MYLLYYYFILFSENVFDLFFYKINVVFVWIPGVYLKNDKHHKVKSYHNQHSTF